MSQRNIQALNITARDAKKNVQELFCRSLHHHTADHKPQFWNDGADGGGLGSRVPAGDPVTPPIVFSSVFFLPGVGGRAPVNLIVRHRP